MCHKESLPDEVPAGRCHGHLDLLHHLLHPLLHPPGLSPDAGQGSAVRVVDVFQTLSLTLLPVSGFDDVGLQEVGVRLQDLPQGHALIHEMFGGEILIPLSFLSPLLLLVHHEPVEGSLSLPLLLGLLLTLWRLHSEEQVHVTQSYHTFMKIVSKTLHKFVCYINFLFNIRW